MYLTRTSPIMRDRKVDTMSSTVAEKTECECDGRSTRTPRAHREPGEDWVGIASATGVNSTGPGLTCRSEGTCKCNLREYSFQRGHCMQRNCGTVRSEEHTSELQSRQ